MGRRKNERTYGVVDAGTDDEALLGSYYFTQLFPFLVLFGLPALALLAHAHAHYACESARAVRGMLSGALSFLLGGWSGSDDSAEDRNRTGRGGDERRRRRVRKTRDREMANGSAVTEGVFSVLDYAMKLTVIRIDRQRSRIVLPGPRQRLGHVLLPQFCSTGKGIVPCLLGCCFSSVRLRPWPLLHIYSRTSRRFTLGQSISTSPHPSLTPSLTP